MYMWLLCGDDGRSEVDDNICCCLCSSAAWNHYDSKFLVLVAYVGGRSECSCVILTHYSD